MCALGYLDPLHPGSKDTQHEGNALGITQRVKPFSGGAHVLCWGVSKCWLFGADKSMCGEQCVYFPRGPFVSMLSLEKVRGAENRASRQSRGQPAQSPGIDPQHQINQG